MGQALNRFHPQALIYYALAAPVLISEGVLLTSYLSNLDTVLSSFNALAPPIGPSLAITSTIAQLLPWILMGASVYALFALRPALMVTLLTVFFLLLTSSLGQVDFYVAALVVVSSFLSLVGFSYARAAKVLLGRKLNLESHGPVIFRLTSLGFDLLLPILGALGVMAVVAYVMGIIRAQVHILPQPLATLGTLYLESHLYLIMTTLTVAGGAVWAMREVLEPIVLRFTLTPDIAREMALDQVNDIYGKILWEAQKKPSRGLSPVVIFSGLLVLLVALLVFFVGPSRSADELLAALGISRIVPSHNELLLGNVAENVVRSIDQYLIVMENILKFIIKLLWG
ncbi:hypothetical protein AUH73_08845 [archaeon 13_1_40CM_4_53_4]|nr:MAG: hypothetical protein AUI07_01020 [archaeon 13_2_20CM_2_53_6]OLC60776.1 MAG: hypothetical protein AUH73_08845 [archaeon 13_1_40CM_4_53_4]